MVWHGDDVCKPHRSASKALRVGYPELQGANGRGDDVAMDLDYRKVRVGPIPYEAIESSSCIFAPRCSRVWGFVEHQGPQVEQ